jgi:alpha-1,3-rhamnosyl/mannosyltransferase
MIIGVDAGALSITDDRLKVGVYRVVVNLLIELGKQDKKNTYRLYSFRPLERGILQLFGSGMTNVVLPQIGWFRLWLPLELRRNPVDVFLGLSQSLPSFAKYSIGFVYDVGFLHFPQAYPGSYDSLKKQTAALVKRSDHIMTISHATAQDLVEFYGVGKNKLTICYPGVSKQFTAFGNKYKSPRPYFLFVGALKRGKNIPTLLEAFAKFVSTSKHPYDLYLVGGNYWLDPAINEVICRLSLQSRVQLLGVVSDEQLASLYRGATALVMPSLWEGFCLPVVEAMASGCPVIVSVAGALPEIIGDAGIIVEPKNINGFANAMKMITTYTSVRKTLVHKGKKRARMFSWAQMAKKALEFMNDV